MKGLHMNNSLVLHLSRYVHCIFEDTKWAYIKGSDWSRDKTRLLHELAVNGPRVLTIDLPALAKHFYKCLDQGQYTPSNLYLSSMVSKRVKVPAFLRDLYLQVFDNEGKLRENPSVDAISTIVTILRTLSKAKLECSRKAISNEADAFKAIEDELRFPTLEWNSDNLFGCDYRARVSFRDLCLHRSESQHELFPQFMEQSLILDKHYARILSEVSDRISSALGDFHLERPGEYPKHGPGRVSNQRLGVSKFHFSEWPSKLEAVFPYDLYARTDFGLGQDCERDRVRTLTHESPSKLAAVPKTQAGPRLIASEPNQHQWTQGLVSNQVISRMSNTVLKNCIDLKDQTHNGRLALESSRSGSHATVDLKSASDRLSCYSVERFFRANATLLERIHATRTRMVSNRVDPTRWDRLVLKKCFTQGNALNFPIQSICYAYIAISAVILTKGWTVSNLSIEKASRQVRIFGDDIIVPVDALDILTSILVALQLQVNSNKTFSKGKFRESCGVDAWDGIEITPSFVKTVDVKPRHEQALSAIESANNLFEAGLWNTANWLSSTIGMKLPIKHVYDQYLGLSSFVGRKVSGLKTRYDPMTQQEMLWVPILKDSSSKHCQPGTYSLFDFFIEKSKNRFHRLDYLNPSNGSDRLVVGKKASVMMQGWIPMVLRS